jgi:hypothetical protein
MKKFLLLLLLSIPAFGQLQNIDPSITQINCTGAANCSKNNGVLTVNAQNAGLPWATPATYGSFGDGTHDDTAAIQSALDSVGAAGGTVFIPQGTYKITASELVKYGSTDDSKRVTIQCAGGRNATILKWFGADKGIIFDVASSTQWHPVTIMGCGFQGSDASHRPIAIYLNYSNGHSVEDNFFGSNLWQGINATSTFNNTIAFNRFYGPADDCIHFTSGASAVIDTTIDRNEFGFCGGWAFNNQSQGGGGSNWIRITNNDCEGSIWLGCWNHAFGVNVVMIGNRTEVDSHILDGTYRDAIFNNTQSGYIAKNEFSNGITISGSAGDLELVANNYYPNLLGGTCAIQHDASSITRVTGVFLRQWACGSTPNKINLTDMSQCDVRDGVAAPVAGTWTACDKVTNVNGPTEQGVGGSKYVITGWVCTVGGTPGTWVPMRSLTGN